MITSESDVLDVDPGIYQVFAYRLNEDEEGIPEGVRRQVGDEACAHYSPRSTGFAGAFLLIAAGLAASLFWSWWALVVAAVLSIAHVGYKSTSLSRDERYLAVQRAIEQWESGHPDILFVLERVEEMHASEGGFDLD